MDDKVAQQKEDSVLMEDPQENLDDDDDAPVFLSAQDAVEVQVDDADVPMDDDDEEEEETATDETPAAVIDMSNLQFEMHTGPVYAVAGRCRSDTDHDSSYHLTVISGGGDDRACLHKHSNKTTTAVSKILQHKHTDSVSSVVLHDKIAAVAGYDGTIVLYDIDTDGNVQTVLEGPTDVEWLSFHQTGTVLLAGSAADGTVWMYHVVLNKCLQVFVGHESAVTAGCFTNDGKLAVSGSSDGTLRVWAPKTGIAKHIFRLSSAGLTCMDINDNKLVLAGTEDGQAHLCHIPSKKVVGVLRHYEPPPVNTVSQDDDEEETELPMTSVEAVGFCPSNPHWCATAGMDGVLKIWDITNYQCRQVCHAASGGMTRLQWHTTLPLVFTATTTGVVQIWDARNGTSLQTLTGSNDVINDMQVLFTEQMAILLTASDDSKVRVFEVATNNLLA